MALLKGHRIWLQELLKLTDGHKLWLYISAGLQITLTKRNMFNGVIKLLLKYAVVTFQFLRALLNTTL